MAPKKTTKKAVPTTRVAKSKKDVMVDHSQHEKDTGSVPVQIGLLTEKISHLTDHLKEHPKDEHGRRGLLHCVGKRRKLLTYFKEKSKEAYEKLIKLLGLRH